MFDNVIKSTSAKCFRIKGKKISKDNFLKSWDIKKKSTKLLCCEFETVGATSSLEGSFGDASIKYLKIPAGAWCDTLKFFWWQHGLWPNYRHPFWYSESMFSVIQRLFLQKLSIYIHIQNIYLGI